MNVPELIEDSLSFLNIPVRLGKYSGNSYPYITFFEVNANDDDYSEDKNETLVHRIQIDFYTKDDPSDYKKLIRKALKNNFYDVTSKDFYDLDVCHVIFECYFYEEEEE